MKILKVSTDLEITAHEFPDGDYYDQNRALRGLIGDDCELYQTVYPHRLYTQLHHSNRPSRIPGKSVNRAFSLRFPVCQAIHLAQPWQQKQEADCAGIRHK